MLAEARSEAKPRRRTWGEIVEANPLGFAFSAKLRFLLGCLLLAGCAAWARQNQLFDGTAERLRSVAVDAEQRQVGALASSLRSGAAFQAEPLRLPLVGRWFSNWAPGVAGAMLLVLALFRGWKMSLFALPAAAVMVWGPFWGLPGLAPLGGPPTTAVGLGVAIAAAGLLFGRRTED